MKSRVRRSFEFHRDHVRAHAEDWQISDTAGANIEISFQREIVAPPKAEVYEFSDEGQLIPTGTQDNTQHIIAEILCSVRLRPDRAFDLAEEILRYLQQMRPNKRIEGAIHAAD